MFNMFRHYYPDTNFHELNADWLIRRTYELEDGVEKVEGIDKKIKELEDLINHLDLLLSESLGKDLVDKSLFNLYAQVIPDTSDRFNSDYKAQGFCIGERAGRPVSMQCFINTANAEPYNSNLVVFTYMDNGVEIGRHTGYFGHSNSCCYNNTTGKYYIACGGGQSNKKYILEMDVEGNVGNQYFLPDGLECWGITWNHDVFYCIGSDDNGDYTFLVKCDNNFNVISVANITSEYDRSFTYQGICSDDNYLYWFNGNTIMGNSVYDNINRCTVMNHNGKTIKQVIMSYPLEMEEADFYNDQMVLSSNTTNIAVHVFVDMYLHNRKCSFGEPLDNIDLNQNLMEIHVDETYKGYFMNGSGGLALSAFTLLILWLRNSTDRMKVIIDEDIVVSKHDTVSFRRVPNCILDIDGQGHVLPNLLMDGGTLYLNNALLPGVASKSSITFHGKRLVLNKITFGVTGSTVKPDRLIFTTAPFEIAADTNDDIIVNQDADWLLYATTGGYFRRCTFNVSGVKYRFNATGCGVIYSKFDIQKIKTGPDGLISENPIFWATYGLTVDIHEIRYPANISLIGGTITNLPSGVSNSNCNYIEIRPIRSNESQPNNTIIKCYMNDGTIIYERYAFTTT